MVSAPHLSGCRPTGSLETITRACATWIVGAVTASVILTVTGCCRRFPAETTSSCPQDCACGDGYCDAEYGETLQSCPEDCTCGNGFCDDQCTQDKISSMPPWMRQMSNIQILPRCNETSASCPMDCHCGNGVCDADTWEEDSNNCPQDCFCGDGVCSSDENWLKCEKDCQPECGNGICECTATGEWGGDLCCFAGLDGTAPLTYCNPTEVNGPETPESYPYDCGAPCPPFCHVSVCRDGLPYYDTVVDRYEVQYRDVGVVESEAFEMGGTLIRG